MKIKIGDRFFSPYFASNGTVVRYIDDNNWWFVLDNNLRIFKAQTTPDKLKWLDK